MAGDDNSTRDRDASAPSSQLWPDDDNPFVAFRRFADEQISSMLQSVTGLPSMVTAPPPNHWSIFADDRYYRDTYTRHRESGDGNETDPYTGSSDSTDNPPSRSRLPGSDDHWQSNRTKRHPASHDPFDIDFFFDSFFDRFWFDDRVSSRFFHPYNRPLFSSMINDESSVWPVTYLMFSPYSPLHLERQAQYRSSREHGVFSSLMSTLNLSAEHDPAEPQWREAFEDLLRLENGKPMLDRDSADVSKRESGKDWLHGLVKRGSLGDRFKYISGTEGQPWSTITFDNSKSTEDDHNLAEGDASSDNAKAEISWGDAEPGSVTELDMYERFLADIAAREREFFKGAHESPLLRLLFEDGYRAPNNRTSWQKENQVEDPESRLDQVSGDNQKTVSETDSQSATNTSPLETNNSVAEKNHYVISTKTSTERIRLPDGSIQTKTVRTQRFADGQEESDESVEVVNPPQVNREPNSPERAPSDEKPNGWFWKDG
ncbi:hypothetical protein BDV26DRAFT_119626 [Aspergillus bertholletiae]|uniref:Uncharacterized protein n=1 Tax=Aspergillus bertholletiae TaxID=1226010 RepID=A0A5N7BGB4_9EURO|nr:hypothetical protein BDV26DRAFT_119626 [Aspergillus bertholletiae]